MSAIDISVIVPIYRVEQFIERSLRSLFCQTKTDGVEFIIINDGTPDRSMEIARAVAADYPNLDIKLYDKENGGLASVRQMGLELAAGEYLLNQDSDDWSEPTMLEQMHNVALRDNADIVVCDIFINTAQREWITRSPLSGTKGIDCAKDIIAGRILPSLCNKLIRRSICIDNDINFKNGISIGEDTLFTAKLSLCSERVSYIAKPFYHYVRYNSNSMTRNHNQKSIDDMLSLHKNLEEFCRQRDLFTSVEAEIHNNRLNTKWFILHNCASKDLRNYCDIYPESTPYIYGSIKIKPFRALVLSHAAKGNYLITRLLLTQKRFKLLFR